MKRILPLIILSILWPLLATAQPITIDNRPDSIEIAFVTCYPGEQIFELYGHTAIHITGRINGIDLDESLNYGLFDFNSDNFVYHFVKGETDYLVGLRPWQHFLQYYLADNRRVVEHKIPLDSVQQRRFIELVSENLRPENAQYRYKWAHDNCATRALRLVENAIGDSIILPQPDGDVVNDASFRQMLRRYHRNYPWYQLGIDIALGSTIDRPMTAREKSFTPICIDLQLAGATVGGRPLTSGINVINEGVDATLPPTPWYLSPLFVFWVLFVAVAAVTARDIRRRKVTRWVDAALFFCYGVAGIVVAFLTIVSVQEGTSPNWLILWLNPLCLIVPALIWLKKCNKAIFSYQIVNFALLILLLIVWPFAGQSGNAAFVPLFLCDALRSFNYIYIYKKTNHSNPKTNAKV